LIHYTGARVMRWFRRSATVAPQKTVNICRAADFRTESQSHMQKRINKIAVLGAGTMGARIAAHLANAGVPSYLFDIVPPGVAGSGERAKRNAIAAGGLEAAKKSKPAAFFEPGLAGLVTVGNFEDDLARLSEA